MHEAYTMRQILKLPLQIESLASHDNHLFIGTKQGHLLMYLINPGLPEPSVQLLRSNKYFSKKPIVELAVVPEYSILIALTDNIISVHDIDLAVTNFPLISQVERSKGTNLFALDVVRTHTLTGESAAAVRMVVSVRRKLQFYYWKNRKFLELREDVSLPDVARSLAWCKESVCIGLRGEYSLLQLTDLKTTSLFPTGRNQDPHIILMKDDRFALNKDDQTTFISAEGKLNLQAVQWSEPPQEIVHDPPFLIGVLSKSLEIRTEDPKLLIQNMELLKPRFITRGSSGHVFCASQGQVWSLKIVSVAEQVPQLLSDKQFELAVMVANSSVTDGDSKEERNRRIMNIKTLFAFDLFCQGNKFKDSLDIFYELEIDPSHVIGLYDGLLPHEYQSKLKYPDTLPILQGRQMENGLLALIEYLTQVRHKLNKSITPSELKYLPMVDGVTTLQHKKQALLIIDTTLLKCYIKTNDALVASLLRLKDNHCHLEETERVLLKNEKLTELVILYNTRNLHRKALSLLQKHAGEENSQLSGYQRIISYLQNLGNEHIDLILEFSLDILINNEDGFLIFTEDMDTVESLSRDKVLDFLLKNKQDLVIPYLEHIIMVWNEDKALFHNTLIVQYKDAILKRVEDGETVELTDFSRKKLVKFIKESHMYDPSVVLAKFPYSLLYEERAILLGKAGRYREALIIYIHVLHDLEAAMQFCQQIKSDDKGDIYQNLVSLLVQPPLQSEVPGLELKGSNCRPPDLDAAIDILEKHGAEMDLVTILQSLPSKANLSKLEKFLELAISTKVCIRNEISVIRGLLHSEHLRIQEERIELESNKIVISEFTFCNVCGKRFTSQSAFVRQTNGTISHYSCALEHS